MITYKDTTFCCSDTEEHTCGREFTQQDAKDAGKWFGSDDYPVAFGNFCDGNVRKTPSKRLKR